MADRIGTDAAETLVGTSDDDFFQGKMGADTLLGLQGNDLFVWSPYPQNDGADIVDGAEGEDTFEARLSQYEHSYSSGMFTIQQSYFKVDVVIGEDNHPIVRGVTESYYSSFMY